jgi:hypothetical protein
MFANHHLTGAAVGSLVAIIACLSAADASSNTALVNCRRSPEDLSARIDAATRSIRQDSPTQLRQALSRETKVAWSN